MDQNTILSKAEQMRTAMREILTISQFAERCPAFKEPALRWLIFNRRQNGLEKSGAIVRNGRRVLLDVQKFFVWLEARSKAA
jgi:hypothetical protein